MQVQKVKEEEANLAAKKVKAKADAEARDALYLKAQKDAEELKKSKFRKLRGENAENAEPSSALSENRAPSPPLPTHKGESQPRASSPPIRGAAAHNLDELGPNSLPPGATASTGRRERPARVKKIADQPQENTKSIDQIPKIQREEDPIARPVDVPSPVQFDQVIRTSRDNVGLAQPAESEEIIGTGTGRAQNFLDWLTGQATHATEEVKRIRTASGALLLESHSTDILLEDALASNADFRRQHGIEPSLTQTYSLSPHRGANRRTEEEIASHSISTSQYPPDPNGDRSTARQRMETLEHTTTEVHLPHELIVEAPPLTGAESGILHEDIQTISPTLNSLMANRIQISSHQPTIAAPPRRSSIPLPLTQPLPPSLPPSRPTSHSLHIHSTSAQPKPPSSHSDRRSSAFTRTKAHTRGSSLNLVANPSQALIT